MGRRHKLSEKEKVTIIILSCHEEEKLREYADMILTLENGRIKDREELRL